MHFSSPFISRRFIVNFVCFIKFKQFGDISYCFAHQMFILLLPCFFGAFVIWFGFYTYAHITKKSNTWIFEQPHLLSYRSMRYFFTSPLFLATLCVLFWFNSFLFISPPAVRTSWGYMLITFAHNFVYITTCGAN